MARGNRGELTGLLRTALGDAGAGFREGQLEAIESLLARRRVLVVQRTGWGKSMVYFLATRMLRDRGAGPTVIVSPLLALMRNQIAAAERIGVRAATVNSANTDEWDEVLARLAGDAVDVLLVSPERLGNEGFVEETLLPIANRIGLFVVDEAHCISDWGHDFRPDYRRLIRILRLLPANVPVLATTATANRRVVDDVMTQLGAGVEIQRGPLMRTSLHLHAERLPNQAARLAWLATAIRSMTGSGIVYCLTKRDAERVARWLHLRGVEAAAYHSDLADEVRRAREEDLLRNRVRALVATTALGMGFDKPDLAFVIHFQCPTSVVHYYQQVGRAGRAIESAAGVLLTGQEDRVIAEFFFRTAFPREEQVGEILRVLEGAADGMSVRDLQRMLNLRQGLLDAALKYLSVEDPAPVVLRDRRWYRTIHPFAMDRERIRFLTDRRRAELDEIHRYVDSSTCLMQFLASALDDDAPAACGRCTPCLGRPSIAVDLDADELRLAEGFLRRTEQPIAPRRRWEGGAPPGHNGAGNIAAALRVEEGRALCVWGDMFWSDRVRQGKAAGRFDDDLVTEAAALIAERWRPDPSPTWVTSVPSLRTGTLVGDFAERLARKLGLPYAGCVRKVRDTPPQKSMENSFHQSSNVIGAFEIDTRAALGGPVLLVDDIVDSRWTFTVVGALLRERIGCIVYPFALSASTSG